MAGKAEIKIVAKANTTDAEKKLAELQKNATKNMKDIGEATDKVFGGITGKLKSISMLGAVGIVTAGVLAGFKALRDYIGGLTEESVKLAEESDKTAKTLVVLSEKAGVLYNAGKRAGVSAEAYARALDDIKNGVTTLDEQAEAWAKVGKTSIEALEKADIYQQTLKRIKEENKEGFFTTVAKDTGGFFYSLFTGGRFTGTERINKQIYKELGAYLQEEQKAGRLGEITYDNVRKMLLGKSDITGDRFRLKEGSGLLGLVAKGLGGNESNVAGIIDLDYANNLVKVLNERMDERDADQKKSLAEQQKKEDESYKKVYEQVNSYITKTGATLEQAFSALGPLVNESVEGVNGVKRTIVEIYNKAQDNLTQSEKFTKQAEKLATETKATADAEKKAREDFQKVQDATKKENAEIKSNVQKLIDAGADASQAIEKVAKAYEKSTAEVSEIFQSVETDNAKKFETILKAQQETQKADENTSKSLDKLILAGMKRADAVKKVAEIYGKTGAEVSQISSKNKQDYAGEKVDALIQKQDAERKKSEVKSTISAEYITGGASLLSEQATARASERLREISRQTQIREINKNLEETNQKLELIKQQLEG